VDTQLDASGGLSRRTNDSKVNGDVKGACAVTKDTNAYARAATSFPGASIYPASGFGPLASARPETTTSYEVGVRSDFLEKRARVSFDLFDYDVKNQQLTAVGGATNDALLLSAWKAVGRLAELTLNAYLTERLLLSLNSSYNFTQIRDSSMAVGVAFR